MGRAVPILSPREAITLAGRLGWTARPKRRSGEWVFRAPDGRRFVSQAPSRSDQVPLALSKALMEAKEEQDGA